jgi:hypothetical protein
VSSKLRFTREVWSCVPKPRPKDGGRESFGTWIKSTKAERGSEEERARYSTAN